MGFGATELLLILVAIVVVFGAGKLGGVGKAIGKSVREFKEEVNTDETKEATSDKSTEEVKEDK